ncbi:ABC transporter ATP-binding protein [Lachnoclostridium phytofermentans]|uniref:ABC transporter ATP-binding protein n=1 Tax=Lachnoclostridium phytofermentans TaxID=66219 RepID=UPI000497F52F|nr:ABC transporter ATP-binding protein [Lachnoclostridium phytofermentans]
MNKLTIRNISKSFGEKEVLKDVSVVLKENELVCLLGVSGAGKTTLFNIIAGLLAPDCGEVMLEGNEVTNQAGNISYMLQKDLLLPYKTIEDNVSLPLIIKGMKKRDARNKVAEYFEEFGLEGTQKLYPASLSGGMRQRAALLRTYLFSDQVALLDEPFSALDMITKGKIHRWYLEIMEKIKLSTLFITHDIDEAILLSDRIYLLTGSPGQITKEIKIEEKRPRDDEFLLTSEFLNYKKEILESLQE